MNKNKLCTYVLSLELQVDANTIPEAIKIFKNKVRTERIKDDDIVILFNDEFTNMFKTKDKNDNRK